MMLSGSQHKERYEQMAAEVNRRHTDWWIYRSNKQTVSSDVQVIIEMFNNAFLKVGPFGVAFVKQNKDDFKTSFYDIPLQNVFYNERTTVLNPDTLGLAYVATSGDLSILIRSIYDFLINPESAQEFANLKLSAICIQTAVNGNGDNMAVVAECIHDLRPSAFYEHPPNGRLLQAMRNEDPPEQSALTFFGERRQANLPQQEVLRQITNLYIDYDLGNIEKQELSEQLYSFFGK